MLSYRIIDFDKQNGSLLVQYKKDDTVLATYNFDIPIENGLYITGEELHERLIGMMPTFWIDRMDALNTGVSNEAEIEALVDPLPQPSMPIPEQPLEQPVTTGTQTL